MVQNGSEAQSDRSEIPTRKAFLLAALDQYEVKLTAYANRLLQGDLDQARDVVQFAFLKLCEQNLECIRPKLAAWLYTVVRNRIFDHRRLARSTNQTLDFECHDPGADDPAERVQRVEFLKNLRGLMLELPQVQREVIDLWSHGFSSTEIAEITHTSAGAVRVSLHRGLKTLKQHPSVVAWLATDASISEPNDGTVAKTKPSRATGFSAKPVDPSLGRSTATSVESKLEVHVKGKNQPNVSMPGRLS